MLQWRPLRISNYKTLYGVQNSVDFERFKSKICTLIRLNEQNKLTLWVSFCIFDPFSSFSGRFEFLFFLA